MNNAVDKKNKTINKANDRYSSSDQEINSGVDEEELPQASTPRLTRGKRKLQNHMEDEDPNSRDNVKKRARKLTKVKRITLICFYFIN